MATTVAGGFGDDFFFVYRLNDRNEAAQRIIDEYVIKAVAMNVGFGIIGFIPGATIPALMAAITARVPIIFQPLARKLARVYLASPDQLGDAMYDVVLPQDIEASALNIASVFGTEFLVDMFTDLLPELGLGAAVSWVPVLGGVASLALDAKIATDITKRVGRMVSIYYQNGGSWTESQDETKRRANKADYTVTNVRHKMPDVNERQVEKVSHLISMMKGAMSKDQIRTSLRNAQIPDDLIEEALKRFNF